MSCETRERAGARRAAFYVLRAAVLRAAVLGASCLFFSLAWPVLGLFYLVARQMPYDLV